MCSGFYECEVAGQWATWLTAAGTIGAVIVALTSEWWWRELHGPKLVLSFGSGEDYQTLTQVGGNPPKTPSIDALYIRVKVRNVRQTVAEKCRAYLVNVERFNKETDRFEPTIYCDSIRLKWSCQPSIEEAVLPIDIPNGISQFVDLLSTRSDQKGFAMEMYPRMNRYGPLFSGHGIYRFTILVTGHRIAPKTIRIMFDWLGRWDDFKVNRG